MWYQHFENIWHPMIQATRGNDLRIFKTRFKYDLRKFYYAALLPIGGAAYCVALCLPVCLSVRPVIVAMGNDFSSTASVTDVLFGTH